MASIQEAINQAKDAAGAMAAQGTDLIEGYANQHGQVQTFAKPSMATVAATTGLLPRNVVYLKPTEFGMQFGKNKDMHQEFKAEIELVEDRGFQLKHTVRFGSPARYMSSYDGVTCNKGGSWHDAMMKARQSSPDADPYYAAEVKLTLLEDIKLKGEVLKAGTVIGYDTSAPSRFSDWSDFFDAATKAGVVGQTVAVKVISREINHNGNSWGTVSFELI